MFSSTSKNRLNTIALLLFVSLCWISASEEVSNPAPEAEYPAVRLFVFYDEGCMDCEVLKNEILPELMGKYGLPIEARYFELKDADMYSMLLKLEDKYQDISNDLPVVFIGDHVLGGMAEIEESLEGIVESYVFMGGCDWPSVEETKQADLDTEAQVTEIPQNQEKKEDLSTEGRKVYLAFFSRSGCGHCDRIQYILNNLEREFPALVIRTFDSLEREDVKMQEAISNIVGIPEEKRLISPTVVIGKDYLVKDEITDVSLEELVTRYLQSGSICVWEEAEKAIKQGENSIIERFRSLGIFAIVGAGLVDGINPCAFTTIIFFLSYLAFIGRKRREVLYTGIAFTSAVFITYLMIGIGAFKFLHFMIDLSYLRHILFLLMAGAALIFGMLSLYDYYKFRQDKVKEMKLQLPKILKNRIYKVIREHSGIGNFLVAAFIAGFLISILELACTGQMYLPTIAFVVGAPNLRNRAVILLILYNLMFVLPLIAIFLLSFYGTTSQKLAGIMMKHLGRTKILTSILFFGLCILLVLTWVRSF